MAIFHSIVGPIVMKVSENSTVPPGNNLTITIEVTAIPAPEIYWTLNSNRIKISNNLTTPQSDNSTVFENNISNNFTTPQSDNSTVFENISTSENFTASHPLTGQVNTTVSERRSFIIR